MYDSVLVATDGSDDATQAASHAVGLARDLEATLYGVSVVETRREYDNAIVDPEEVRRRLRADARDALSDLEEAAESGGIELETAVLEGVPHEELLAYADDHDVDAIVVGARGESSFKRVLLGSTVDAIVRLSPIPVVVVGGENEAEEFDERQNL
ncbi:universal stress protein [Natrialbaceae archaeon A-gly3]